MMPSSPPNGSSSLPSFFRSRFTLACRSLCSDLTSFLGADLWERRPRHGSSGARPHRRQCAAVGSRRCSRRLEANPVELLRHQLRLTILSKTPQESLRTVQRGGRSTTVFSNSDLVPPSSIPVQPPPFAAGELEIELSHGCRCFLLLWRKAGPGCKF
uniref:Uncharacterized protein n=1 Tax=Oryza glumipatula TaxID=40148 RepID=A0A0D9Z9I8_9ORYZ